MKLFSLAMVIAITFSIFTLSASAQTWNLQLVDNAGDIGYCSRIIVTSDGTPYILYASNNNLYLAWWISEGDSDGLWNIIAVPDYSNSINYQQTALCVDQYDQLHLAWVVSYSSDKSIYYAVFDTSTDSFIIPPETATSGYMLYTPYKLDMGIVDDGGTVTPTIIYTDAWDLKCTTRNPSTELWNSPSTIYDAHRVGDKVSVAVDSTARFHVSFYEEDGEDLMYATKGAGEDTWTIQYVDIEGDVGLYNSIIINDENMPFIVYYDQTNGDLKYAKMISE